jgi:hypothetical protein
MQGIHRERLLLFCKQLQAETLLLPSVFSSEEEPEGFCFLLQMREAFYQMPGARQENGVLF